MVRATAASRGTSVPAAQAPRDKSRRVCWWPSQPRNFLFSPLIPLCPSSLHIIGFRRTPITDAHAASSRNRKRDEMREGRGERRKERYNKIWERGKREEKRIKKKKEKRKEKKNRNEKRNKKKKIEEKKRRASEKEAKSEWIYRDEREQMKAMWNQRQGDKENEKQEEPHWLRRATVTRWNISARARLRFALLWGVRLYRFVSPFLCPSVLVYLSKKKLQSPFLIIIVLHQ